MIQTSDPPFPLKAVLAYLNPRSTLIPTHSIVFQVMKSHNQNVEQWIHPIGMWPHRYPTSVPPVWTANQTRMVKGYFSALLRTVGTQCWTAFIHRPCSHGLMGVKRKKNLVYHIYQLIHNWSKKSNAATSSMILETEVSVNVPTFDSK